MAERKPVVLVVDDNPDHRQIATALLTYGGYTAIEADSVETGELLLREESPDLLLLDLDLPEKTGAEWASELRNDPTTAALPIAIYSSFWDVHEGRLAELNVRVISKSEGPQRFLNVVEAMLGPGPRAWPLRPPQ